MCEYCGQWATHRWCGEMLCGACYRSALADNFWELISSELVDFDEEMEEVEVRHFRNILDAD